MLRPFRALRYDEPGSSPDDGVLDLSSVLVPARDCSDLPEDGGFSLGHLPCDPSTEGPWQSWVNTGIIRVDDEPAVYTYRSGYRRHDGTPVQGCGVFGVVGKARITPVLDARPVVASVDAPALTDLLAASMALPLARGTDTSGAHHRLWAVTQSMLIETIVEAIQAAAPHLPSSEARVVAITPDGTPPPLGLILGFA